VDPGRQTRRKKGATTAMGESECEKIVVTVDGKPPEEEDMEEDMEEEKTRIDYLHKPVLLRREGVHVVKAVCTTGSRFGTQNQAEYVVLPSLATTGARGGVGLLGEEEDQRQQQQRGEKDSWSYFLRDIFNHRDVGDAWSVRRGVSVLPRGVWTRRATVRRTGRREQRDFAKE
jgi:hypothetical protein